MSTTTHRRRYVRRTDLFLVRVWTEGTEGTTDDNIALVDAESSGDVTNSNSSSSDVAGQDEWSGRVQRVVDGEAHQFKGWQSLVDTLLAMLSESRSKPDS